MTEQPHLSQTRAAYDTVAADYAEILRGELASKPLDRALLGVFAEQVRAADAGPAADIGCGPGRITTYLSSLGLTVSGIDLSPEMIAVARKTYPELRFEVGSMLALDLPDDSLGGIVAWYSIIHTPPEEHPVIFAEFERVLAPGGHLLLGFQVGDVRHHIAQGYGHPISLDAYRLSPDRVAEQLAEVGLTVTTRVVREPVSWEKTPQAYLLVEKPATA